MAPWYARIKEADAVVLGSPVYFDSPNATMLAFLERFFGYRRARNTIKGKPFVLILVGCGLIESAPDILRGRLAPFEVNILKEVLFASRTFPCHICGDQAECTVGGIHQTVDESRRHLRPTPSLFQDWQADPGANADIAAAAEALQAL